MTTVRAAWSSWAVRGLVLALIVKVPLWVLARGATPGSAAGWVDDGATVLLVVSAGMLLARLVVEGPSRLLWRVRRKLFISYLFIGLIPVILGGALVLLAAFFGLISASSYLVSLSLEGLVTEARVVAEAVAAEEPETAGPGSLVARHQEGLSARHPGASLAVVPAAAGRLMRTGDWSHEIPPTDVPGWMAEGTFAGLVVRPEGTEPRILARALVDAAPYGMVVVDVPVGEVARARVYGQTGVTLLDGPTAGMERPPTPPAFDALPSFAIVQHTSWDTGETAYLTLSTVVAPRVFYDRVFQTQLGVGNISLGDVFVLLLAVVASLFLVIEVAALTMGFTLARSITGAVHELGVGTERVRAGDFGHRIVVETGDQLGELAESFNAMTGSVQRLLQEVAEKKRLEEELRIARRIQMSLLPRDTATVPGATVSATCVPAREVGGDYYDFIPLGDHRLAIVVADVSGKGTSAAFYMAELKGLILSLSRIHDSPQRLLIEANRIITPHIDSRSFITMMYAVLDTDEGTLTYARAGHTPLMYLRAGRDEVRVEQLTPSGLVVGLDGLESEFESLIEEDTLDIGPGDVAVFYTDGISEAMNEATDLFGEDRLSALVEAHHRLGPREIRERIVSGVSAFAGTADQHDDMTLVLCKIDAAAPAARSAGAVHDAI